MPDARVGGAYYEVRVDNSQVRADMARTEKVVTEGVGRQVSAFTSLVGKVTALIGTFAAFYAIGQKVRQVLSDNAEAAERFVDAIDTKGAAEQLATVEKRIQDIQNLLSGSDIDIAVEGTNRGALEKELSSLQQTQQVQSLRLSKERAEAEDKLAKENAKKRGEAIAQRLKEADDLYFQYAVANGTELDRIRANAAKDLNDIEIRLATESNTRIRDLLIKTRDEINRSVSASEYKALEEQIGREEELRKELHDKEMNRIKEEGEARLRYLNDYENALRDIQSSQTSGASLGDVVQSLTGVRRELQAINRKTGLQ